MNKFTRNLLVLALFLLSWSRVSFGQSSGSQSDVTLGPYDVYYGCQPANLNLPLLSGQATGCADEGRRVNIGVQDLYGPIRVNPDNCVIQGPVCPTYDAHGDRIPAVAPPNNCVTCNAAVRVTQQPAPGTTVEAGFTAKDNGFWTKCSTGQQNQFPQKVFVKFNLIGIKIDVPAQLSCNNGQVNLSASVYPSESVGSVTWYTTFGVFTGNHLTINLPANFVNSAVHAVYTVNGVSCAADGFITVGNLTGFRLPYCVDVSNAAVPVRNVAILSYSGVCWPLTVFNPVTINTTPALMWSTVNVGATANGVTLAASTIAVNSNKVLSVSPATIDIFNIIYKYKAICDQMQKGFDKVAGAFTPCGPLSNNSINIAITVGKYKLCCNTYVKDGTKIEGSAGFSYGKKCHFPIPFLTVPGVFSVDVVVQFSIGFTASINKATTCTDDKICWSGTATGSVGGGIGITVLSGVVKGDVSLVCEGISLTGGCCYQPQVKTQCNASITLGRIKAVGTITFAWFYSMSVDYPLFDGWTWQIF